jgi:hypothetical protein
VLTIAFETGAGFQKDKGELFLVSNFIWINLMGVTGLHADML